MIGPRIAQSCLLATAALAAPGCDHSDPFRVSPFEQQGPFPIFAQGRRLTFNPLDDRDPFVFGDVVYFSRLESVRVDGDRCIGIIPVEGGTMPDMYCAGGEVPDQNRDARLQPAVSPDGSRIAYVIERSRSRFNDRAPNLRNVVVAPRDNPADTASVFDAAFVLPNGASANDLRQLEWRDSNTLRFIAGLSFFNTNTRDTVFQPMGVHEFDIAGGRFTMIAGTDDAFAFASRANGGLWYVTATDSTVIMSVEPGAVAVVFGPAGGAVRGITNVGGMPVVIRYFFSGDPLLGNRIWISLVRPDGTSADLWRRDREPGGYIPRRIVGVPGRTSIIAEMVRADPINGVLRPIDAAGGDLWLFEF